MAYFDENTGEIIISKFRTISDLKGFSDNEKQTKVSMASQNTVSLSEQVYALLQLGSPALRIDEKDYDIDLSKMTVEQALDAYSDPTEEPGFDLTEVPAIMEALNNAILAERANASKAPTDGAVGTQENTGTQVPDVSSDEVDETPLPFIKD